jgi:hypothetical protein
MLQVPINLFSPSLNTHRAFEFNNSLLAFKTARRVVELTGHFIAS